MWPRRWRGWRPRTASRSVLQARRRLRAGGRGRVLVAAGRAPVVDELGLEAAGVEFDRLGIKVDARMRTSRKHIFACGDVTGIMPFTHVAEYQAGVIISNAVFRVPKKTDYSVIPWVTYCDPELAQVGLTGRRPVPMDWSRRCCASISRTWTGRWRRWKPTAASSWLPTSAVSWVPASWGLWRRADP